MGTGLLSERSGNDPSSQNHCSCLCFHLRAPRQLRHHHAISLLQSKAASCAKGLNLLSIQFDFFPWHPVCGSAKLESPMETAEPLARWAGIRKAEELSPACPQSDTWFRIRQRLLSQLGGDPSKTRPADKTSEDCLDLNVMTPHPGSSQRLPVMFYIHGGSGTIGRGDDGGAALAATSKSWSSPSITESARWDGSPIRRSRLNRNTTHPATMACWTDRCLAVGAS